MISKETFNNLLIEQEKLDKAILDASQLELKWNSLLNVERLKLSLLVEVGETAQELKTFKIWKKKKQVDLDKVKEELVDCLCFFLGLWNIHQIDSSLILNLFPNEKKDISFNKLLLDFFLATNNLRLEEERFYEMKNKLIENNRTYYDWLKIFYKMCEKLQIDQKELFEIYKKKNKINYERTKEG